MTELRPPAPSPGKSFSPNARLVELLGEGGMGSVWLARHATLDTEVAVNSSEATSTSAPPRAGALSPTSFS